MHKLLIYVCLFGGIIAGRPVIAHAQVSASAAAFPSPEEFVNAVYHTVVDTSFAHYYLVIRADTCRFVKYDYDEWTKYYLQEPVSFNVLNDLAEKVYLSRYPYSWKQGHLQKAICITQKRADSIFSLTNPALEAARKKHPKRAARKVMKQWQRLPLPEKTVFSFSLPQFTDDGQYAVIDLNLVCGTGCGAGYTCLFRHTSAGWRLIGKYTNWSS